MNNAYGLLHVQEANLKILKELDRICEKFRIPYVLDAGTLLGAIRHGGFIPWDDDADVVMPRNGWEAFRKVAARELPEGMKLVLGCYAYAFFLNFRRRIYEKTTFPLLLLTSGFLNHMLVTASRWIFLNDAYGMSSRYALQYQVGIAGILLTLAVSQRKDLCGAGSSPEGDRSLPKRL